MRASLLPLLMQRLTGEVSTLLRPGTVCQEMSHEPSQHKLVMLIWAGPLSDEGLISLAEPHRCTNSRNGLYSTTGCERPLGVRFLLGHIHERCTAAPALTGVPQPTHPHLADEAEDTLAAAATSLDADSRGGKGLQFSDKDEHMYFWFPLLAGLSELTFDPRPDIRYSALEVNASTAEWPAA